MAHIGFLWGFTPKNVGLCFFFTERTFTSARWQSNRQRPRIGASRHL